MLTYGLPDRQGLYDPRLEHDACGIGFVANIKGKPSHSIVDQGVEVLVNLTHRGACGCDPETGDGAGLLLQIPHGFFAKKAASHGFALPPAGEYGVGMVFVDPRENEGRAARQMVEEAAQAEGFRALAWRRVPTNSGAIGWLARESEPHVYQVFLGQAGESPLTGDALERKLYILRKRTEQEAAAASSPATTRRRCRQGRSATRACFWPRRSSATTRTLGIRTSRPPSR